MTYPPEVPNYRIAIGDTIVRAYRTVFDNSGLVVRLGWAPAALMFVFLVVSNWLPDDTPSPRILAGLLSTATFVVFSSVFMFRWHRFVLLGETANSRFLTPGSVPFLIAIAKLMLLTIASTLVIVVLGLLVYLGLGNARSIAHREVFVYVVGVLIIFVFVLLAVGVSLAFPAAAIARPISFRGARTLLAGNFLRLFVCAIGCGLPLIANEIVAESVSEALPEIWLVMWRAIDVAIVILSSAVFVGALADVYRNLLPIDHGGRFGAPV